MELKIYPDPILSKPCKDVEIGDDNVKSILNEMSSHLYEWNGAGLAAPQVGILKKLVVIDVRDDPAILYKMINPKIIWKSTELVESEEGCLSLPALRETVLRHESVEVAYLNENFQERTVRGDGFFGCCLQHEIDHLSGVMYIDHLSRLRRNFALKKFARLQKDAHEGLEEARTALHKMNGD